jgi:hypothetical protein
MLTDIRCSPWFWNKSGIQESIKYFGGDAMVNIEKADNGVKTVSAFKI